MSTANNYSKFSETLFVYGTLTALPLLKQLLGRLPLRRPAQLEGFRKVLSYQNGKLYPNLKASPQDRVVGFILELSPGELAILDNYEGKSYHRIKVFLVDGSSVWVYLTTDD